MSVWRSHHSWPMEKQGAIDEARRLWKAVGRQNVMVKVPATAESIPAIEQLISEGINLTREGRTAVSFCKLPAMTQLIWRYRGRSIPLAL